MLSSHLLSKSITKNQSVLQLVRWGPMKALTGITTVCVREKSDIDFLTSIRANLTSDQHLLVISSYPPIPSLKELVAVWRRDSTRNKIYLITINNSNVDYVEKNLNNVEFAFNCVDDVSNIFRKTLNMKMFGKIINRENFILSNRAK